MDYAPTAQRIIEELGGNKNIERVTHCMTRLRFNLKDESIVDDAKVEKIKGVMGIMKKGGQYQVIIGNHVQDCYKEILKLGNFNEDAAISDKKKKITFGGILNSLLDTISGTMAPLIPALIGCGMIKLLIIILGLCGVDQTAQSYLILTYIGDAAFYFMPLLLAFSAAKKFGCSPFLAVATVSTLLYPDFVAMLGGGEPVSFIGIPVYAATYSSSLIPALLTTYALKWIEKLVDKITPSWTKTVFKPMIVLLITVPIAFWILGPIGAMIGEGLAAGINWLQSTVGWLTLAIGAAFMPFIVMTGMHYAFTPTTMQSLANPGYDLFLLPAMLCSNIAQGAAALAVGLKSKNKELKSVAIASAASALAGGITEPALYGVTLKLKKPMIAACIGGGAAGLLAGIAQLKCYSLASPSVIASISFISPDNSMNFVFAILAMILSFVITFVLTLIFGFKDPANEEDEIPTAAKVSDVVLAAEIMAPVAGEIIALRDVNDEAFSTEVLGKGIAIVPSEGKVFAPFDGRVDTLFDTNHAMGLVSDTGIELLIHIGLETVRLEGKGFTPHIKSGDSFKKGELLMEFDINLLKENGYDVTTPIVVTNYDQYTSLKLPSSKSVDIMTKLIAVN